MEWYQGGIVEAVTLSRQNGSIFVVYIEGKDDKSKKVTEIINSKPVATMLNSNNFVAIHVEQDSVTQKQFSEIYKQNSAPSICFIGKSGVLLDIITEALNSTEMPKKINEIIIKNGGEPMKIEEEPIKDDVAAEPVNSKGEEVTTPSEPIEDTASTSAEKQLSIDEKIALAQEIIAQKRKAKEQEEKEKDLNKEVERRKLGQDVQKMKRWQQDQEMKQLMEERQKAKLEDKEARERVKRQIEEDKREKAARMMNNLPQVAHPEPSRIPARHVNSDTALLQFRLPNGTQITHDFKSTACLQEVIDYLHNNQDQNNFVLSTTYPKREFTQSDACLSLLDLQLVPNAAILVLPNARRAVVNTNNSGGITGMFWYLLTPFFALFEYFKSFIGRPKPQPTTTPPDNVRNNDTEQLTSTSVKRRKIAGESKIRKQGNIHRLHDNDSDDDNNTWNGNSTQQM